MRRPVVLAVMVLVLTGCALPRQTIDQRTTQGPSATDFWAVRVFLQTGREPTFEERRHFEDQMDDKVGRYLREHQEAANALTVTSFRFLKQVTVGMDKGQVEVLLGAPLTKTEDAAQMQSFARHHWTEIRGQADEAWTYPFGWVFYFKDSRVVDITQYVPAS